MNWQKRARTIIKVELTKKNIGYEDLARMLNDIGINETKFNIANKLHRGTFSFAYALQIFKALDVKKLDLGDLL